MTENISIKDVLLKFLKENISSLIGYLFCSMAIPISTIYLPHLYGKIITRINQKHTIDKEIKMQFTYIFILWILIQILWSVMNIIDSKFIPNLRSHVRKYIVEKVIDAYKEDYSEEELGGVMSEIVRLPDEIEHMFSNIRNHIMPITLMLISSIGYFTWANPLLGGMSILSIGAYLAVAIFYSKKCIPIWGEMNISNKTLHGEINDSFGNLLNIYTANQNNEELLRLDKYEKHFSKQHCNAIRCTGNFRLVLNLSYIFVFCGVNILSFYLFSKEKLALNKVVSILIISLELISKMSGFIGSIDKIMYETSTIQQVQESISLLDSRHTQKYNNLSIPLNGDIEFRNVNLSYNENKILQNINLLIKKGTTTVLVGEIGSGKTSLLNSLIRLTPFTGKIMIGDRDIRDCELGHLREHMLYIPQNPRLFNRTIYENISYGNNASKKTVQTILERYAIPFDINRQVGKFGQSLSGGQRQIVYLLRCLFRVTPIILLDEPTASLDNDTKKYIMDILRDLLVGRTVIIVSHDPLVLEYANRIVKLEKGKIV
jgi:ATP-binding cassette subfamily B protein